MPSNPGTMRTILLSICIAIASTTFAQRECATSAYSNQLLSSDPSFLKRSSEIENFIQQQNLITSPFKETGESATVIRIPVVVHVLYNSAGQNISNARIKSQIDALNRDFRRRNADTANTPERFKSIAADVMIEFVLATVDPNGRATNGVIRKNTKVSEWKMDDKIKFSAHGGDDAWDSRYYLNFWVGYMRSLLGYSSPPGGPADKDGIVISTSVFGTENGTGAYDKGRTCVHEVGHYLGLRHIWGDTYCGDDFVSDTPPQGNFTSGCPTGFRSSCNNGNSGDMYMNYMDFTNDPCMNLFTNGQKDRMLTLFNPGGPRHSLLSSKGLSQPWNFEPVTPVTEIPVPSMKFKLFPNPAANDLTINVDYNETWIGKTITIVNLNGITVTQVKITSATQKLSLASLKPGMYFIQGENEGQRIREKFVKL